MIFRISIEPPPNLKEIVSKLGNISAGKLEQAAKRAVRRTLRGGRQDASRKIAQRYTIRAGVVIKTIKLSQSGLSGAMTSSGSVNPLRLFKLRPRSRPKRMPKGGVYVQNVKGQGGYIRQGFLSKSGTVLTRVGRSRYPIKPHAGPSSPGMLSKVGPDIESKMFQRLQINLDHELAAVIGGFA